MASAQDARQTQDPNDISNRLKRKRTGVTPPPGYAGCKCKKSECANKYCPCNKREYGCTSKCTCHRCVNAFGIKGRNPDTGIDLNIEQEQAGDTRGRGNDSSTEPGQGCTGGLSNAPADAVQTVEPPHVEEQSTQSGDKGGLDLNKQQRRIQ